MKTESDPLQVRRVRLDDLHADPANTNTHDELNLRTIRDSLKEFGQVEPLVVHKGTNKVIGGNGRLAVMRDLGITEADVVEFDGNNVRATALGIALNRTAKTSAFDDTALAETLRALQSEDFPIEAAGFTDAEVDELLEGLARDAAGVGDGETGEDPGPQVDRAAELQEKWGTAEGQVWELGSHRLAVGDCRDQSLLVRLMGGDKADLLFTDPPYNQAEHRSMTGASELRPDSYGRLLESEWDRGFSFLDVAPSMLSMVSQACSVYVCMSEFIAPAVWAWMSEWSDYYSYCVWCKPNPMPSLAKRHWTWATELIGYATRGKRTFNFPEAGHALNWWEINVEQADRVHPTQKPVAVPRMAIEHSSGPGQIVADPFSGSGTTLVACEQTGRRCRAVELSPAYCAVILERLSGLGLQPRLAP